MLRLLIAFTLTLFCLASVAAVPKSEGKCDEYAQKIASKHYFKGQSIWTDFEKEEFNYLGRYKKRVGIVESQDFFKMASRLREKSGLDQLKEDNLVKVVNTLKGIPTSELNRKYCDNMSVMKDYSARHLKVFKKNTKNYLDELERYGEVFDLGKDEGAVIVSVYVYGAAGEIELDGPLLSNIVIGPLRDGQHFEVYKLKKGNYRWDRITNRMWNGKEYFDFEDAELEFNVLPGKLNYTGVFIHRRIDNIGTAEIVDRTAIVLNILEKKFPEMYKKFDLVNALYPNDPFLKFYHQYTSGLK